MEGTKYPVYMGIISDLNFDSIHTMSVVSEPAMEEDFVFLSKTQDNVELAVVEGEKHLLTGPALIPNKLIFRNDEKRGKHYLTMDEKTVELASQKFLKDFNQSSVTLDHSTRVNNLTVVESWIIEEPENDKAAALGFKLPKGTWMISMKVENERVWQAVKEGQLKGFSIEALFTLVKEKISEEQMLSSVKEVLEEVVSTLESA